MKQILKTGTWLFWAGLGLGLGAGCSRHTDFLKEVAPPAPIPSFEIPNLKAPAFPSPAPQPILPVLLVPSPAPWPSPLLPPIQPPIVLPSPLPLISPLPIPSFQMPPALVAVDQAITQKFADINSTGTNKMDILWVIDNSGTMTKIYPQIQANIGTFMASFTQTTQLDWKMGLLSTDDWPGNQNPYIGFKPGDTLDSKTPNAAALFNASVTSLGSSGNDAVKVLKTMIDNFHAFPNFLRPDAMLSLIVITDEDENGSDEGNTDLSIPLPDFWNQMAALGKTPAMFRSYGIFDLATCNDGGVVNYATSRWKKFIDATNGLNYSACAPNWAQQLSQISAQIIQQVNVHEVLLPQQPIPESIHVFYQGKELPGGPLSAGGYWVFDYDRNSIQFERSDFVVTGADQVTVKFQVFK